MSGRARDAQWRAAAVLTVWALLCAIVAAGALQDQWHVLREACTPGDCVPLQLSSDAAAGLHGIGLATYAGVVTALCAAEALVIGAVAVLTARRAPLVAAVLLALAATTGTTDLSPAAGSMLTGLHRIVLVVAVSGLFALLATFPTTTFVPRWVAVPALVATVWTVIAAAVPAVATAISADRAPWSTLEGAIYAGCVLTVLAGQVIRYHRADEQVRLQLRTVLVAVVVFAAVGVAGAAATAGNAGIGTVAGAGWNLLGTAALALVVVTLAVAMVRHGAYGVRVLVNRVLSGAAVVTVVVAVYAAAVAAASVFVAGWVPGAIGAAVTAVVLAPLMSRFVRAVDRFVYGDAADPALLVAALGDRLAGAQSPVGLTTGLADLLARRLRFPRLVVRLSEVSATAVTGTIPDPPRLATVPLGSGCVDVVLRPGQRRLSARDRRALSAAAGPLAAAAVAERLSDSLRRSRTALLTSQEEERRSLRRQLHDELGPTLASLRHRTGAARRDLREPEQAERWLEQADAMLADVLERVRTLSRDLRPPELDEVGLSGAVRNFATGLAAGMSVVDELTDPLPAAVELAAYRVITEALLNAERHAGASSVRIRLHNDPDLLRVEVTDDGAGFDPLARSGVGLATMRERAEELGGTITIDSGPSGGTSVTCELPLGTVSA